MDAQRKVRKALNRQYQAAGRVRVAGQEENLPPPPPPNNPGGFAAEGAGNLKRAIPDGYSYDPRSIKPMAKMLWAMSVSLGHAMAAHKEFTKLKSGTVSPDGLIGGRGYVMSIKDMRKELYNACEGLSALSDTIHDEINAPHWKPKLAQLERDDVEDISQLVGDAERIMEDPEGEAEEDIEEAEEGKGKTKGKPWTHPAVSKKNKGKAKNSELPNGDDQETIPDNDKSKQSNPGTPMNQAVKNASVGFARTWAQEPAKGERFLVQDMKVGSEADLNVELFEYERTANSSEPVQYLPGGPRVDHLDRGDNRGDYNDAEPSLPEGDQGVYVQSEPARQYDYPSDWENEFNKSGTSAVPDSVTDPTPTQGFDYGLGDGDGNDAHGQGQNHEVKGPGGGVYSPSAELPGDVGGNVETDDTTPAVELSTGGRHAMALNVAARVKAACEGGCTGGCKGACGCKGDSTLPNDGEPDVARSDYFEAATALPGDGQSVTQEHNMSIEPGTGYRYERLNQPYIKWDTTLQQPNADDYGLQHLDNGAS